MRAIGLAITLLPGLAAVSAALAQEAVSQRISVSGVELVCEAGKSPAAPEVPAGLSCKLSNNGPNAVDAIFYTVSVQERGRRVPWVEARGITTIPGGLEPGEAIGFEASSLEASALMLPERAVGRDVVLILKDVKFILVDEEGKPWQTYPIDAADSVPDLEAALASLRRAIGACWSVGSASPDTLRASVVVKLSFDRHGSVTDVALVRADAPSEDAARAAFSIADRAIRRCAAHANLPRELHDSWREIEVEFDFNAMRLR